MPAASIQCVFQRHETKYLLASAQRARLESLLAVHMTPDAWGRSTICSVYYDTPSGTLARRSMEHPLYKEKIRLRSYGDIVRASVFLELKKKYDDVVYKRRCELSPERAQAFLAGTAEPRTQIERELAWSISRYDGLCPSIYLAYERDAFYDPADHDVRITLDQNLRFRTTSLGFGHGSFGEPLMDDGLTLVEVKTGQAIPLWLARFLSEERLFKSTFSKYSCAYRAWFELVGRRSCRTGAVPATAPVAAPRHLAPGLAIAHAS